MEVSDQTHAPAAVPLGRALDAHWTGGWVGPRTGGRFQDGKKRLALSGNQIMIPLSPSPQSMPTKPTRLLTYRTVLCFRKDRHSRFVSGIAAPASFCVKWQIWLCRSLERLFCCLVVPHRRLIRVSEVWLNNSVALRRVWLCGRNVLSYAMNEWYSSVLKPICTW